MNHWDKISLYQFQQIQVYNAKEDMSDMDKVLWSTCAVFGLTEFELNNMKLKKASRLINKMTLLFKETPSADPQKKIGEYILNYEPGTMTLGQYISLGHYLTHDPIQNAHKVLATISSPYNPDGQETRSDYFLKQAITKILGTIKLFSEKFLSFNKEYKNLFGLGTGDGETDPFHKRFGWISSAVRIANHNIISLDEAYGLPVRQAFNDLAYLKAKDIYDEKQFKKK